MKPSRRSLLIVATLGVLAGLGWGAGWVAAEVLFWILASLVASVVLVAGIRRFLWSVGRRLALSYFLIGIVPIPMVALLILVSLYLLSGFFLGHLYRDGVDGLQQELAVAARLRAEAEARGLGGLPADGTFSFAYYRDGKRVGGDTRGPESWPEWLELAPGAERHQRESTGSLVALEDGSVTMAAAASAGQHAVVSIFAGNLEEELERRSEVEVDLLSSEEVEEDGPVTVQLGGREWSFRRLRAWGEGVEGEQETAEQLPVRIVGMELSGALTSLRTGEVASDRVAVTLFGTPGTVFRHLFSSSSEVDTSAWLVLVTVALMLLGVYAAAEMMALFLIFGISRAVNQLSLVTAAVREGDFSVRIPVRRRDQIGELQSSFNRMGEHLEELVASAAQKESLEKELAIARELQESLLPRDPHPRQGLELATWFEPSAAIGGDYFDILRVDQERLVVVIADVSGHGLSAGLRMAMVKAALVLLVEEGRPPVEIFKKLDGVVRSSGDRRSFVTATLAVIDTTTGEMELTNAGHPPTYLLRGGEVRELLLPGSPLGSLGGDYGEGRESLAPGDVVVWLSDGLIEACDHEGEPFGFEGVEKALLGPTRTAAEVRERLLAAVRHHTGSGPVEDDRTLVVLRYLESVPSSPSEE